MSQPTDQEVMLGIFEDLASLENIFKNNAEAGNSGTVVVEEEEQIPSEGRSKTGGVRITISLPPSTPPESAGSKTSQSSSSNSSTTSSESTDISSLRRQADEMVSPPISIPSFNLPCCRISHDAHLDTHGRLIAPCLCEGSLKYVHEECLQRQIEIGQLRKCEVCQFEFERRICVKPKHERKCSAFSLWKIPIFLAFQCVSLLYIALDFWFIQFMAKCSPYCTSHYSVGHFCVALISTQLALLYFAGIFG